MSARWDTTQRKMMQRESDECSKGNNMMGKRTVADGEVPDWKVYVEKVKSAR